MTSEIPDWEELPEEIPPEQLQRKWLEREHFEKKFLVCPGCQQEAPAENLTCIFCGVPLTDNTGLLGCLIGSFKKLFRWKKN